MVGSPPPTGRQCKTCGALPTRRLRLQNWPGWILRVRASMTTAHRDVLQDWLTCVGQRLPGTKSCSTICPHRKPPPSRVLHKAISCQGLWHRWSSAGNSKWQVSYTLRTGRASLCRFDPVEHFDTVPELADRAYNRPRRSTLETAQVTIGPTVACMIQTQIAV